MTLEQLKNHPQSPLHLQIALAAFEQYLAENPLQAMNAAECLAQAVRQAALAMMDKEAA